MATRRGTPVEAAPADVLRRMLGGFSLTQMVCTACRIGLPDRLALRQRSAAALARELGCNVSSLRRFMRMLVAVQLLEEVGRDSFRLSPLGQLLRSDHPQSLHERALYIGEVNYPAAREMLHAVRTGRTAFEEAFGTPFFEYLSAKRDLGALFNRQMNADLAERIEGLVAAYDFGVARTVVDVGGGNGSLLATILRQHPRVEGRLFESDGVAVEARRLLRKAGVADRCQTIAGDFLRDRLPSGADLYVLSQILHDWRDPVAVRILRRCRTAMSSSPSRAPLSGTRRVRTPRLLIVEQLLPSKVADAPATIGLDFSMLLLTGGRERTQAEYRALLAKAGLRLSRVIPFQPARIHSGRSTNWAILECAVQTDDVSRLGPRRKRKS